MINLPSHRVCLRLPRSAVHMLETYREGFLTLSFQLSLGEGYSILHWALWMLWSTNTVSQRVGKMCVYHTVSYKKTSNQMNFKVKKTNWNHHLLSK